MISQTAVQMDQKTQLCIQTALDCESACQQAIAYCFGRGADVTATVRVLIDCADICNQAANFLLRESENAPFVCRAAAEVCRNAALECGRFDDAHLKVCAEIARQADAACSAMDRKLNQDAEEELSASLHSDTTTPH